MMADLKSQVACVISDLSATPDEYAETVSDAIKLIRRMETALGRIDAFVAGLDDSAGIAENVRRILKDASSSQSNGSQK